MFPLLTPLFIMAMVYGHLSIYPAQFSLAIMGYVWFLIALITLLCRRFSCSCGLKTRSSSDVENSLEVENIYENDLELKSDLM